MIFYTREEVVAMTPLWKGERFEDGRPKVADRYLDALYAMTLEELWKPIFVQGYENNFVSIKPLHPEFKEDGTVNRKMIGRAVTAMYLLFQPVQRDSLQAETLVSASMTSGGEPFQARQATGSRPFDVPSGHTPCADTTNTPRDCCSTPKASGALRIALLHVSGASFHIPSAVRRAGRTGFRSDAPIRIRFPWANRASAGKTAFRSAFHSGYSGSAPPSYGPAQTRASKTPCAIPATTLRESMRPSPDSSPIRAETSHPPLQVPAGHERRPGKLRGAPLRAIRYQVLICSCSSSVPSSSKTMKSRMCMPTVSPMCSWRYV